MAISNYIVTEPAPSSTSYIRSGRGGAGNIRPVSKKIPTPVSPSSPFSSTPPTVATHRNPPRRFFSGIGGAGNAHSADELRPHMSLHEDIRHLASREAAPVGHCGIGGAGNVWRRNADGSVVSSGVEDVDGEATLVGDNESQRTAFSSSKGKLWSRVSGSFTRQ